MYQGFLFVWMALIALTVSLSGQKRIVNSFGQKEIRCGWITALALAIPLIYLAGTRSGLAWGDTSAYKIMFDNLPNSLTDLGDVLTEDIKDKGFTVVSIILKSILGNSSIRYFTVISIVCIMCVVWVYKKHSCNLFVSIFLFVSSADYLQWSFNGMRQFIAIAILFACVDLILKRKYTQLILIILLVSTIHASALLMLPIIFIVQGEAWNKKTFLFLGLVVLAIVFLDQFTNLITTIMENTQYSGEIDQYMSTKGTNMLRVVVYSIPTIAAFIFRKRIKLANNRLINLAVNMSIASMGCYLASAYTSGLFIGRIPAYFSLYNYILIPWMIENVFEEKSAKFLYIVMIVCYLLYYYYQVTITWGL